MKRIDQLVGATVREIHVGRNGTLHIYVTREDGVYDVGAWSPMVLQIPKEPRKRKARRP